MQHQFADVLNAQVAKCLTFFFFGEPNAYFFWEMPNLFRITINYAGKIKKYNRTFSYEVNVPCHLWDIISNTFIYST